MRLERKNQPHRRIAKRKNAILVVRTGFEPVDKKYLRCDLLLRLRNLIVTIPIPPPDCIYAI